MEGTLEEPPIIIRSSASRNFLLMLFYALAAAACGLIAFSDPSQSLRLFGGIVAFGLAAPYFAWRFMVPDVLTLSRDGLAWRSRWRTTRWSWNDVSHFRAVRVRAWTRSVGFDFRDPPAGPKSYTDYDVSYAGADASIGAGWELSTYALVELLNTAQARWGNAARSSQAAAE